MMKLKKNILLIEVAEDLGIDPEIIVEFISYQWITPMDQQARYLDEEDVARIGLIRDLKENFGVNDEAIPIILHLIDQLNHLHNQFLDNDSNNEKNN